MSLLGMIMESLVETPDPSMMEMHQRDEMSADKMAMESLGGLGELPETQEEPAAESYEPEVRVMSAADALAAIEANIEVKTGKPVEMNDPESIFKALESELPTDKAPYDPTAELDDVAKILAGLDADDDMSPDQPQPDEKVEGDMDVGNLINENQDKEKIEDAGRIDHATEGFMAAVKNFFKHDDDPESKKNREKRLREMTPEQVMKVYAESLRRSKIKVYKITDTSSKYAHDSAELTMAAAKNQGLKCKIIPVGNGEVLFIDGGDNADKTTVNAWCNIPHLGGDNLISDKYDSLIKCLAKDKEVKF